MTRPTTLAGSRAYTMRPRRTTSSSDASSTDDFTLRCAGLATSECLGRGLPTMRHAGGLHGCVQPRTALYDERLYRCLGNECGTAKRERATKSSSGSDEQRAVSRPNGSSTGPGYAQPVGHAFVLKQSIHVDRINRIRVLSSVSG